MSSILTVQPAVATAPLPAVKLLSIIRPTLAQTMRVLPHTIRAAQPMFNPMQPFGHGARPAIQSQPYELPPSLAVTSKASKKPIAPSDSLSTMGWPSTNASDAAPAASTSKAPTLTPIKSVFQQRLGISRKRRQSSDFQPERGVSSMFPASKPVERSNHESELIQQKELFNIFNVNADDAPETPSKRRRVDSLEQQFIGRRTSFGFDVEVPTEGETVLQFDVVGSSASHLPDLKFTKGMRSPKLTLDDLRAPTPKPLKTKGHDGMTMPIMLLHTPQQKKLFDIDATPISKPAHPFAGFTPPSASDTLTNLRAKSPKISLTPSAFSSSIFARFKTGVESQTDLNLPHAGGRIRPIGRQVPLTEMSPCTVSAPPRKDTATSTSSLMETGRPKNPTTSTIVKHLLTGNSVVLDRIYGESKKQPDAPRPDDTIPRPETRTGNKRDLTHKNHPAIPESTRISTDVPRAALRESTMVVPVTDLNSSRNPWGRPPSWKPKSPRMIDMERKRQADRAHRLAAKNVGPMSLSLSQPSLGSLKVSVYGRASVSVPSSSSVSFSSSSSLSSRSFHSDSSLPASQSHGIVPVGSTHDDAPLEELEDDDDAREFSPPPVSPIRETADPFPSFSASVISERPQGMTGSTQLTKSLFQIPTRSFRTYSSPAPVNVTSTVPIADASVQRRRTECPSPTTATVSQRQLHSDNLQQEADRKRLLEQSIQEDEFFVRDKDEDETILNSALQPIFAGANRVGGLGMKDGRLGQTERDYRASRRSLSPSVAHSQGEDDSAGGLFDEVMPEALDPDEALWEITELFS
ncbi:hypothetical protein EDD21DRAFT_97957 [Dissophora ornata]|nr:hypothetical protein EDD21DRAFT_97957 [Dissophora ornata]